MRITRLWHPAVCAGHVTWLIAACSVLVCSHSLAQEILIQSHGDPAQDRDNFTGSVGIQFVASGDGMATELGYVDFDADGLAMDHAVGLYSSDGNLLGSVTVPMGTSATPRTSGAQTWRYASLSSPVAITAGTSYRIAAEVISASGDPWGNSAPTFPDTVFNPLLTDSATNPVEGFWLGGAGLTFPTNALGSTHFNKGYGAANILIISDDVAGDVTGDGMVTIADFDIIRDNFYNEGVTRMMGDLTGDGRVTISDFDQWKDNYPGDGAALFSRLFVAVPEPGSVLLMAMGCIFVQLGRRMRHR